MRLSWAVSNCLFAALLCGAQAAPATTSTIAIKRTELRRATPIAQKAKSGASIDINMDEFERPSSTDRLPAGLRPDRGDESNRGAAQLRANGTPQPQAAAPGAATPAAKQGYTSDRAGNKIYDDGTYVRSTLPGSGGYKQFAGGRQYDDGTVVDSAGNVRVIDGQQLPPGTRLDDIKTYMRSNPGSTVKDALQSLKGETK